MAHVFEMASMVFQLAMFAIFLGIIGYGLNRFISMHLASRASLHKMSNVELARARAQARHSARIRGQALS